MSNIHGLYSKPLKDSEKNKPVESWNGNGTVTTPNDIDQLVKRAQDDMNSGKVKPGETQVRIVIYKNGIVLETKKGKDSEFKDYNDPDGKRFYDTILQGRMPPELSAKYGMEVDCELEDRRSDTYKVPVPVWSGQSVRMGEGSLG